MVLHALESTVVTQPIVAPCPQQPPTPVVVPAGQAIPSAEASLALWERWAVTETLVSVVNLMQPDLGTARNPPSLAALAGETMPLVASGKVPITTLEQAIDASVAEQEWADFRGLAVKSFLGRAPMLLAQYLARERRPLGPDLVAAFGRLDQSEQAKLLALLNPSTPQGLARCQELTAPINPDVQDHLCVFAVDAGIRLGDMAKVLGVEQTPESYRLNGIESLVAHGSMVRRGMGSGMSLAQLSSAIGPFITPTGLTELSRVFMTTEAGERLRAGQSCEEVVRQWGCSIYLTDATDLRFLALRDEELRAYEIKFGLAPDEVSHATVTGRYGAECVLF